MPKFWKLVAVLVVGSALPGLWAEEEAAAATTPAPPPYVVHEWGTFTSVQGSDGVLLEWRPLETSELPEFVYDRSKSDAWQKAVNAAPFTKSSYRVTERMETPVLYFYPEDEIVVDVSVKFPKGAITEWYPMARAVGPESSTDARNPVDGYLRWGRVRLFPARHYPEFSKDLPESKAGKNYFAARETDSAFVRVGAPNSGIYEHEKFLFYRGVGTFKAPLEVISAGADVRLTNHDAEAIPMYFVLTVGDKGASFVAGHALPAGGQATSPATAQTLASPEETATALGKAVESALLEQGLYEKEAAAMVKTWRESWFLEKGTRVLYILPASWTDRTLPLTLNPAPTELKRVMVGRAELLTADMEQQIAKEIAGLSVTDFEAREKATRALSRFGRFAEPALQRVISTSTDPEAKSRAQKLIEELRGAVK